MNSPSPAGDLPSSSSEAPAAAPLASAPAAPPELNGERAPLDIGLDVMVTSEGLEAREVLPQIHDAQPRRHTFRRRVRTPLILFLVTFIVNGIARLLVWNVTRG